MVVLSGNRIAWQYHAADGTLYRVAAQKALTDQGVLGGEAWAGVAPAKPGRIKMRRITVHNATYGSRVLPVYSDDASIITAETSVNVNAAGDSRAFTSTGALIPESWQRASPVTTQSS